MWLSATFVSLYSSWEMIHYTCTVARVPGRGIGDVQKPTFILTDFVISSFGHRSLEPDVCTACYANLRICTGDSSKEKKGKIVESVQSYATSIQSFI